MVSVSKRQILAVSMLITIAMSTIAWAQMSLGTATVNVTNTRVKDISPPAITIDKGDAGTETKSKGLNITVYFQYVEVRVALVDLGNLYDSMDKFFVIFNDTNHIYAILSLDEPTATFIYNATGKTSGDTATISITASWKAGKKPLPKTVSYGVAAEVIGVYGNKL